jgi:hypothetical protein
MLPPASITVLLPNGQKTITRSIYSIFPAEELHSNHKLPLLEANYIKHALPYHLSDPVRSAELLDTHYINVNAYESVEEVIQVLKADKAGYRDKKVVSLRDWNKAGLRVGRDQESRIKKLCGNLEMPMGCDATCRSA